MKIATRRNIKRRKNYSSLEQTIQQLRWCLFSMIGRKQNAMCLSDFHKYDTAIHQVQSELMLRKAEFSISKIRNVCYITRRERGVSRAFRLSRQTFKEKVHSHYFVGVTQFPTKG